MEIKTITLETLKNLCLDYINNSNNTNKEFNKRYPDMNKVIELNELTIRSRIAYNEAKTNYENEHNVKIGLNPTTLEHYIA